MTKTKELPLPFDIVAFAGALIGGPVLATIVLCWLIIPLFALAFGGPVYLVIGTPVLLWMVGRYPPEVWRFALAGFAANLALCGLIVAADTVIPAERGTRGIGDTFGLAAWGVVFGPIWAGSFAACYRKFNRMTRLVPQS